MTKETKGKIETGLIIALTAALVLAMPFIMGALTVLMPWMVSAGENFAKSLVGGK